MVRLFSLSWIVLRLFPLSWVVFLSYNLLSCKNGFNGSGAGGDQRQIQQSETSETFEITGTVSAEQDFGEQGMVTGRMVTGRMITGRIVTARSPRIKGKEDRVKVSGARITVEELGVSVESDSNGNFSLPVRVTGSCPCRFTLSVGAVRKDGKGYRVRQSIEITPEEIRAKKKNVGDLMIYASGGVAGNAKLKEARSSSGIYVYVPGSPIIGTTDENGNFVIGDIPPGTYKFVIEKVGYESKVTENVQVDAGKITYIGDFELVFQGGEQDFISGRVFDTDGNPVAGAFVVSDTGRSALSDKYGNFQILGDAKKLTVGKEGYEFSFVEVGSLRDLKIELKRLNSVKVGGIKGKIYNWTTTKPVGGVTVLVLPSGNATTTDRDGSFAFGEIDPGSYTLMFIKSDYEIGVEVVSVGSGQVVDLGILGLLSECTIVKFYRDSDGDGFGSSSSYVEDCYAPYGYVGNVNDCDDGMISVHPGAVEMCNGIDDNCDGNVDENVALTFYKDGDGDGFGTPGNVTQACEQPLGYVRNSFDCDDTANGINPSALEICNNIDDNCDGSIDEGVKIVFYRDADGDTYGNPNSTTQSCAMPSGYVRNNLDCNDNNSSVWIVEVYYRDVDGDTYGSPTSTTQSCGQPSGYVRNSNDCDDTANGINPSSVETCNGVDDNCNGSVDEGVKITYYRDADGDNFGSPSSTTLACSKPSGYVENNLDCNDASSGVKPTAVEVCDSTDQDCDGLANNGIVSYYFRDSDGDGQGWANSSTLACSSGTVLKDIYGNTITGYVSNSLDCNDSNSSIKFGINETVCDGVDENCNGIIDDGVLTTFYRDSDGDGFGNPASTVQSCAQPSGYSSNNRDCNDSNANFNPSVTEIVDNQDENCDGQVDNLRFSIEVIASSSPVHYVDLDSDSSGNLHVAYNYTAYGGPKWLGYLKRQAGGSWDTSPSAYYLGGGNIYNCSIDVSSDGVNRYFSFSTTAGGSCGDSGVCSATYYAGSWTVSSVDALGRYSSVAFIGNDTFFGGGVTHIVYSTDVSIVHTYATPSTPSFSLSSVVTSTASVTDIDIVLSPDGSTVHIVFAGLSGGIYYPYYTRNIAPHNFTSWLTPVAISTYTYNVKSVGIALYSDGATHICFTGENTPNLFYVAASNGGGFGTPSAVDTSGPMSSCSISLDSSGNPHISYYSKGFGELRYAALYGGTWKSYKVSNSSPVPGNRGVGIVIDSRKIPHIVFIMNGFLAYARLD